MKFSNVMLVGVPALFVGLLGYALIKNNAPIDTRQVALNECITHQSIDLHYHPYLTIYVDDVQQTIPEVGDSASCMRPIHTHDTTGKIHIEYTRLAPFTLGDFFAVWGESFQKDGYSVAMTVNGTAATDGEAYVMKDADQIVLRYTSDSVGAEAETSTAE